MCYHHLIAHLRSWPQTVEVSKYHYKIVILLYRKNHCTSNTTAADLSTISGAPLLSAGIFLTFIWIVGKQLLCSTKRICFHGVFRLLCHLVSNPRFTILHQYSTHREKFVKKESRDAESSTNSWFWRAPLSCCSYCQAENLQLNAKIRGHFAGNEFWEM